jgi:cytidine deaminase
MKLATKKGVYELTDQECRKLIKAGDEALKYTFPRPNDGFAVALMTKSGNIYAGASYGSDTATLTMHSEATALTNAANHGETEIVAITGPNCHICKQLIYESSLRSGIDTVVIIEEEGKIKQIPISTLMPYPWPEKDEIERKNRKIK